MQIGNWDIEVHRNFEVTSTEMGWLNLEHTIWAVQIQYFQLWIVFEKIIIPL
jgi:hypothetical protein